MQAWSQGEIIEAYHDHANDVNALAGTPLSLSTGCRFLSRIQAEKNFEAVGLESAAFFRPSTLVGNENTPGWLPVLSRMVSWAIPLKFKEIHIEALGGAMVKAAVSSLDEGGPPSARYEGESLFKLTK